MALSGIQSVAWLVGALDLVGTFVFAHRSPSHLQIPAEFEAFDPALLGARRALVTSARRR